MKAKLHRRNRFILMGLILIFSVMLAACGDNSAPAEVQPASDAAQPTSEVAQPTAESQEPATQAPADQPTQAASAGGEVGDLIITNPSSTAAICEISLTKSGAENWTPNILVAGAKIESGKKVNVQNMPTNLSIDAKIVYCDGGETTTIPGLTAVPHPAEAPKGQVLSDSGFRPEVNGFALPNFGGEGFDPQTSQTFSVTNLTSIEMRRLFGDGVCAAPAQSDGTCVLTPPASQWMEQRNSGLNGGHCEGFAALSQLIYDGKIDPNQFGAARTIDLKIAGNEALQRELAFWWATQIPTFDSLIRFPDPNDAIKYMQDAYAKNTKDMLAIGIYKEDRSGGHAITGYGVSDQGNGIFWILVYDNNYPGQERHVIVDTNAHTWEYEASTNPAVEPSTYRGGKDNPIEFLPDTSRVASVYPCPFCGNAGSASIGGAKLAAPAQQFNEISVEGYVNVELQDAKGRKVGYDENGKFVNEITEAQVIGSRNETVSDVSPVINMPVGLDFTAYLWGDDNAEAIPASLVMIGQGFYVGIDNLVMKSGQEDQLYVDGAGDVINYKTDAQESPDIIVGIEKPAADFELVLKAVKVSKGTDISVVFDQKEDTFAFQTASDAPAEFSVSITRIDADGKEETFDTGDTPITIDPEKLMYFYFGKWQGQGSNLEVGYDENGNGTIEDSEITNMADAK